MWLSCDLGIFTGVGMADALGMVRDAGLASVDVAMRGDTEELDDVAGILDAGILGDHGLTFGVLDLSAYPVSKAVSLDPLRRYLARAERWGARYVAIALAEDNVDTDRSVDSLPSDWRRRIVQLAEEFASAGEVTLCICPHRAWCGHSRQMASIIREIGHPAVRLQFDCGAYPYHTGGANGEIALQRLLGAIGHVVLTDWDGTDGQDNHAPYPPLGQGGEVDYAAVLQVLRATAFAGPCSIRFAAATVSCGTSQPTHPQAQAGLTESCALLRHCGWMD